jgi:hypothetical protein
VLRFEPDQDGRRRRVVVDLDGASLTDTWLRTVEAVNKADQRLGPSGPGQRFLTAVIRVGTFKLFREPP